MLGRSYAYEYEALVAGFLDYCQDPMVARLALQILCAFWDRAACYRESLARFIGGVGWDEDGDVRQIAISAPGEVLASGRDRGLLARLLRLSDPAHADALERRIATEAIARALGLTRQQVTSRDVGDGRSLSRAEWATIIRSRGMQRLSAE